MGTSTEAANMRGLRLQVSLPETGWTGSAKSPVISKLGESVVKPDEAKALLILLDNWQIPTGSEDAVHDMARASLDEVKGLTEYEDAKVGRLLTIVAFLTALAGAVFSRFTSSYPLPRWNDGPICVSILPALTYFLFFVYVVVVAVSAFAIFGAIKPTFNEPAQWRNPSEGPPKSMNFYARILDANPRVWGQTFVDLTAQSASGSALKARYAKDYIFESYLIAEKVAQKLEKVAPAVKWLQRSMLLLAGFMLAYAATLIAIPEKVAS